MLFGESGLLQMYLYICNKNKEISTSFFFFFFLKLLPLLRRAPQSSPWGMILTHMYDWIDHLSLSS